MEKEGRRTVTFWLLLLFLFSRRGRCDRYGGGWRTRFADFAPQIDQRIITRVGFPEPCLVSLLIMAPQGPNTVNNSSKPLNDLRLRSVLPKLMIDREGKRKYKRIQCRQGRTGDNRQGDHEKETESERERKKREKKEKEVIKEVQNPMPAECKFQGLKSSGPMAPSVARLAHHFLTCQDGYHLHYEDLHLPRPPRPLLLPFLLRATDRFL